MMRSPASVTHKSSTVGAATARPSLVADHVVHVGARDAETRVLVQPPNLLIDVRGHSHGAADVRTGDVRGHAIEGLYLREVASAAAASAHCRHC
jgi:hypothetical protein